MKLRDGSVIIVSVDDAVIFDAGEQLDPNVPVIVNYRILVEPEEESELAVEQEESEPEITDEPVVEVQEEMVWIPQSGSKYHSKSGCSRMKNPTQVTVSKAESMGYTPCKKCY